MNIRAKSVYLTGFLIIIISIALIVLYPFKKDRSIDIIIDKDVVTRKSNIDLIKRNLDIIGMKLKPQETRKILIFFLNDKTHNDAFTWISDGFPSIINSFFSQSNILSPFPVYRADDLTEYIDQNSLKELDLETAIRIAELKHFDFVIQGDYYLEGNTISFSIRIFNVKGREILRHLREEAQSHEEIFRTIHAISNYCLEALNIDFQEKAKLAHLLTDNSESFQYYQEALWDFYQGIYSRSVIRLKKALELDNKFILCYYYLGIIYRKMGIKSDYIKTAYEASRGLNHFYQKLIEAEFRYVSGDITEAIGILVSLMNIYSTDKQVIYLIADYYFNSGEFEKSLEYIEKVLTIDPEHITANELRAHILTGQGDMDGAITAISEIIMKRPFAVSLYLILSSIFEEERSYDFAAEQCKTAMHIDPDYTDAKLRLSKILIFMLEPEKALDTLRDIEVDLFYLPFQKTDQLAGLVISSILLSRYHDAADYLDELLIYAMQTKEYDESFIKTIRAYIKTKANEREEAEKLMGEAEKYILEGDTEMLALYISILSLNNNDVEIISWMKEVYKSNTTVFPEQNIAFLEAETTYYERKIKGYSYESFILGHENLNLNAYYIFREIGRLYNENRTDILYDKIQLFFNMISPSDISLEIILYYNEILDIAKKAGIDINYIDY